MKKLLLLISFLFCAVISFCQFPINTGSGSPVTQTYDKGSHGSDSGYVYRYGYTDTSVANHGFLKNIPGIVIRVADTLFMRNNATTKWMNIGSGGSSATTWDQVMTNNPDLQSNYVSSFTNHTWDLQRISDFTIHSDGGTTTRLKINAGASSMFSPNGSDGIMLTNDNITIKNLPTYISRVDSIGRVINYSWGTNPLGSSFSQSGTALITTGLFSRINGTTTLVYNQYTGVEDWHILQTIITNVKTSSVQTFKILLVPTWQNATFTREANFVLSQDSGYISYQSNDGATIPDTTNKSLYTFLWNAGDTLDVGFYYSKGNITAYMTNRRTGQQSLLYYKTASVANVANIKIAATGDFSLLNNFQYFIDEPLSPDYSATGNSITIGSGASSIMYRWMNQTFQGYSNLYVIHGSSFERSTEALLRIQELCHIIKPHYGFWGDGVNDPGSSILPPAYASNVVAWVDSLIANNIVPILISCSPQVTNMTPYNDSLRAIATRFGLQYIDVFTLLVDPAGGTNRNPKYNSDGVHFNDAGYKVWSGAVQKAITSNLKVAPTLVIPHINLVPEPAMKYIIGLDYSNQLVASVSGLNNGYIENILSTNVTTNGQQTASISIGGRFVHFGSGIAGLTDFIVVGQGNLAVPNFKVQAGVVTAQTFVASTISSANFSTTGTQSLFNAGTILEANGVFYRNTSTNGYLFKLVNASITGFIIDEEVAQGPNMIIQQWNRFGTKVALVNRGGGAEFDSTVILPNIFARVPDTTTYKPMVVDGSGNVFKSNWAYAGTGGGGTGTDNANVGTGLNLVIPSTQQIKRLAATLYLTGDSTTTANTNTIKVDTASMFPVIRGTIITGATAGNNTDILMNRNGLNSAPGGDSLKWTSNGLDNIYRYLIGGVQVLRRPTGFTNTLIVGDGAAPTHTTGNEGYYNTIVQNGGNSPTTGAFNVALGTSIFGSNLTGNNNIAIGFAAGSALTGAASSNVLIGTSAGQSAGSGVSNVTAVGFEAMKNNTANSGTALGFQAMNSNTTGTGNVANGFQSILFNQTGNNNTGVGQGALLGVSGNSFTNNTGVGFAALLAITTGKGNTAVGDSSNFSLTTAFRTIAIGTNILTTGDYSMNIGGLLFGTGMTATGTSTAGNFGIAVVAPTARLMLPAGTATASTAPLKFTSGTNLTSAESGAMEWDGTDLYITNSTAARGRIAVTRTITTNNATENLIGTRSDWVFTGTIATWTLGALTGSTDIKYYIKNRGSGTLTINSNAGGNDIYTTLAVSTTTIAPGGSIILVSDGTFWLVE